MNWVGLSGPRFLGPLLEPAASAPSTRKGKKVRQPGFIPDLDVE